MRCPVLPEEGETFRDGFEVEDQAVVIGVLWCMCVCVCVCGGVFFFHGGLDLVFFHLGGGDVEVADGGGEEEHGLCVCVCVCKYVCM